MKIHSAQNNKNQEVVFTTNPEQLKDLAYWLLEQAESMSKNPSYSHEHIKGMVKSWHKKWPDIIVQNSRNVC